MTDTLGNLQLEPFRMEIAGNGGFIECSPTQDTEIPTVVVRWVEVPPEKRGQGYGAVLSAAAALESAKRGAELLVGEIADPHALRSGSEAFGQPNLRFFSGITDNARALGRLTPAEASKAFGEVVGTESDLSVVIDLTDVAVLERALQHLLRADVLPRTV